MGRDAHISDAVVVEGERVLSGSDVTLVEEAKPKPSRCRTRSPRPRRARRRCEPARGAGAGSTAARPRLIGSPLLLLSLSVGPGVPPRPPPRRPHSCRHARTTNDLVTMMHEVKRVIPARPSTSSRRRCRPRSDGGKIGRHARRYRCSTRRPRQRASTRNYAWQAHAAGVRRTPRDRLFAAPGGWSGPPRVCRPGPYVPPDPAQVGLSTLSWASCMSG